MEEEKAIIEKLLQKDPAAVGRLVDLYASGIHNVAFTYLQSKEDAEEICNDVFLAVCDSIHKFDRNSSLKTWMHRIAINKSLDFLKFKKRKKRFGIIFSIYSPKDETAFREPVDFRHPGVELESKEMHDSLFAAINQLPDNQKIALVQSCFEKQTHKEIAEILDTSEKAVESLLYRSKTNLRKLLEEMFENFDL